MAGLRVLAEPLHFAPNEWPPSNWNFVWFGPQHCGVAARSMLRNRLEQLPGEQLAIVRYLPGHDPLDEWVYNAADIDDSKVDMGKRDDAAENLELIRYYPDRKVWLVEPDADSCARVSVSGSRGQCLCAIRRLIGNRTLRNSGIEELGQ